MALLNKVYCPREVFPIASVVVAAVDAPDRHGGAGASCSWCSRSSPSRSRTGSRSCCWCRCLHPRRHHGPVGDHRLPARHPPRAADHPAAGAVRHPGGVLARRAGPGRPPAAVRGPQPARRGDRRLPADDPVRPAARHAALADRGDLGHRDVPGRPTPCSSDWRRDSPMSPEGTIDARHIWKRFRADRRRMLLRDELEHLRNAAARPELEPLALGAPGRRPGGAAGRVGRAGRHQRLGQVDPAEDPGQGHVPVRGQPRGGRPGRGADRGAGRHPPRPHRPREHLPVRLPARPAAPPGGPAVRRHRRTSPSSRTPSTARSSSTPAACRCASASPSPPSSSPTSCWSTRCWPSATRASSRSACDRMREVLGQGTTLVFVSHDLAAVEAAVRARGLAPQRRGRRRRPGPRGPRRLPGGDRGERRERHRPDRARPAAQGGRLRRARGHAPDPGAVRGHPACWRATRPARPASASASARARRPRSSWSAGSWSWPPGRPRRG